MAPLKTEVAFGLQYLPASAKVPTLGQGDALDELERRGIHYIRFQWVDYINLTRYRVIPLPSFRELLTASRPGVGIAKVVFGLIGVSLAPGFSGTGEYLYTPDLTSTRICGYAPGHASVMGWFEEKLPIQDNSNAGGDPFKVSLCPRGLLRDIVSNDRKGKALGVDFLVGIETKFILLKSTNPIEAVNDAPWSASRALLSGSNAAKCLEDIADALRIGDIEVLMYHAEAAPGQYEIVTGPLPPVEAADAVVFTRETIINIAAKHGLHATFSPRVYAHTCGSAAHAHISIHPTPQRPANPPPENPNTNQDTTMTPLERSFLQSLLDNLPSSTAFTLPTVASYDRVQDGIWSGGTYACWGVENRETTVRLTGAPGSHHFEVRTMDGTSNPHIALATILGLGLVGVQKGLELKIKAIDVPAVELSAEERTERGIKGRLWRTLSAARDAARQDATIINVLGQEFVQKYLDVNEVMENFLKSPTLEEEKIKGILNY
ncbi:FLU1-II [Multifurca ochricompacta]|uniref:Glutamine synthetase n=1 Tax=Multifurca ochricompacta TaxID=376703 RepID=A0AAD4QIM3_9AGAM|nr:FLU1-II [Multifurca ochricompacta]